LKKPFNNCLNNGKRHSMKQKNEARLSLPGTQSNQVTGASLIRGMIRELAILGVPVSFTSETRTEETRIIIPEEAQTRSTKTILLALDGITPKTAGTLRFCLDDNQYEATLQPASTEAFSMPETITIIQRRTQRRSSIASLSTETILAEIRGKGWRYWGRARDCNTEHLVAELDISGTYPMSVQDNVEVRVYAPNQQTMHASGWISLIRTTKNNTIELVFCLTSQKRPQQVNRVPRQPSNTTTNIELHWPDEQGLHFIVPLLNTGFTGFAGSRTANTPEYPPVGAICKIAGTTLNAKLAWIDDTRIGFDLRSNNQKDLDAWHTSISGQAQNPLLHAPQGRRSQRLLSILMRSGYLRSKRANVFVKEPELHRFIPGLREPAQWLRRYTNARSEHPDVHVAFSRLSDTSWMIQEVANGSGTSGIGAEIIQDALFEFFGREQSFLTTQKTLITLFDMNSRFNREFWLRKPVLENTIHRDAVVLELQNQFSTSANEELFNVITPDIFSWHKQYAQLDVFDPKLLLALGITANTYDAPELQQDLAHSGYLSHRQVRILMDTRGPAAIAVAFGLPTLANATATANAVWLLCRDHQTTNKAIQTLNAITDDDPLLLGCTDLIVMSNEETPLQLSGRAFGFLSIPLLSIPSFLGLGASNVR
jgi:hypothetical protein